MRYWVNRPKDMNRHHRITKFQAYGLRLPWRPLNLAVTAILMVAAGCSSEDNAIVVIALNPTKSNIVYVATNTAVYKTRDTGKTWERFPGFSARRVTALAIDPKFPATVYGGTMGDAVYKSPDGGQRWLPHNVGLKEHVSYINQFAFDPLDTTIIYAATTVGVYRTRDGARVWKERMTGMKEVHIVVTIALNPKNPNVLYAGTTGGVYRTRDGALTWEKVNEGLIPPEILEAAMALGVNILAINPADPDIVYAGTTKGLFQTTTGGETWVHIGESLPDQFISTIAIDPTTPQHVYVGGRAGVFKSQDGGHHWQARHTGLKSLNIRTIVISPLDSQTVYVGTNGTGLYRSSNGGETWSRIPLTAGPGMAGGTVPR